MHFTFSLCAFHFNVACYFQSLCACHKVCTHFVKFACPSSGLSALFKVGAHLIKFADFLLSFSANY